MENKKVSLENQEKLAAILNDKPSIVSLEGTPYEIRALRMGTQWLIAEKCIQIAKAEDKTFGDIIKQFSKNIKSVVEVLVLAMLNDKNRIFKDGIEGGTYSEEYQSLYDTLMWDCDVSGFGQILFEVLKMIDTSFFMESCRILEIFRESTMARKNEILEQKSSIAQAQ